MRGCRVSAEPPAIYHRVGGGRSQRECFGSGSSGGGEGTREDEVVRRLKMELGKLLKVL